jgi:hypothetical protein
MAKLRDIYEKYSNSIELLNSARKHRRRIITDGARTRSFTGVFYWLPTIDNRWIIDYYTYQEHGDVDFDRIWNRYVIPHLSQLWDVDIKVLRRKIAGKYAGLPRGIVTKNEDGQFVIYHGGDFSKRGWENKIIRSFNLRKRNHEFRQDALYGTVNGDHERVSRVLNTYQNQLIQGQPDVTTE